MLVSVGYKCGHPYKKNLLDTFGKKMCVVFFCFVMWTKVKKKKKKGRRPFFFYQQPGVVCVICLRVFRMSVLHNL